MSEVTYEIVEHDGGWAYKVDGAFSEPFPTHAAALKAAQAAAAEQRPPARPKKSNTKTRRASGTRKQRAAATGRTPTSRIRSDRAPRGWARRRCTGAYVALIFNSLTSRSYLIESALASLSSLSGVPPTDSSDP